MISNTPTDYLEFNNPITIFQSGFRKKSLYNRSSVQVTKSNENWCVDRFGRKEGNVLFNDALNTFYLRLYGVRHMVKDHSDSEKGNPLPPHRLLFPISNKSSFICTIPETG